MRAATKETEEVTPGEESAGLDTEQVNGDLEVIPESVKDRVGEEPSPYVPHEVEREASAQRSPMIRDVNGIRPVAKQGVLLDKNTENIVTFPGYIPRSIGDYTPRKRKRLTGWTEETRRLSPASRREVMSTSSPASRFFFNHHMLNPGQLHLTE